MGDDREGRAAWKWCGTCMAGVRGIHSAMHSTLSRFWEAGHTSPSHQSCSSMRQRMLTPPSRNRRGRPSSGIRQHLAARSLLQELGDGFCWSFNRRCTYLGEYAKSKCEMLERRRNEKFKTTKPPLLLPESDHRTPPRLPTRLLTRPSFTPSNDAMTSPTSIYSPFLNPLNAILLLPLTYLLYLLLFPPLPTSKPLARKYDPEVYNWLPATHSPVLLYKKYTAKELSVYDGKGGGRICLAILRVGRDLKIEKAGERTVFDVTSGRGFYGPSEWTSRSMVGDGLISRDRWDVWEFCRERRFEGDGETVF